MKSTTKKKRAHRAYEIMQDHIGVPKTLGNWLTIINEGLTNKISLRSTKELAHMFRYISFKMDVKIEREIILRCAEGIKISNTYCTLFEG